jgi:hypothetical protein
MSETEGASQRTVKDGPCVTAVVSAEIAGIRCFSPIRQSSSDALGWLLPCRNPIRIWYAMVKYNGKCFRGIMKSPFWLLLPCYALCLALFAPAQAQVTGRLSGTVVDASGASIGGAAVEIRLAGSTSDVLTAVTTADGIFHLSGVRPALYDITVKARSFRPETILAVKIDAAVETTLPRIRLELGSITESVEVSAAPQQIQTGNAEVTTTLRMDQIRRLPTIDRSPLALIRTQPGVVTGGRGLTSIDGERTSFTNLTLDGINIQDNFIRDNALDFSPNLLLLDEVGEVTLTTSNANSAFGFGASQVAFVTPSGTNEYHGSGYWSNRNYKLSANNWFNNQQGVPRPPLNENQIGGQLGGTIIKNKLFFYTNYEAFRLRQQTSVNRTILTASARQGIYTYQDAGGAVQKVNILQAAGVSIAPAIQQLLQQVPSPDHINNFLVGDSRPGFSRDTGGDSFLTRSNRTRDNVIGKVDYILSTRNVFSGTYSWNRDIPDRIGSPYATDYSAVPKVTNNNANNLLSVTWRWNPSASFTNELRGGFDLAPAIFQTSQQFGSYMVDSLIFSNPVNTYLPQGRHTNTYNFADNASYNRGRHNIQFGFQMQKITVDSYDYAGTIPDYTIGIGSGNTGLTAMQLPGISASDLTGANNMLASLVGLVSAYTQTLNVKTRTSGFVNGAPIERNFRLNNYAPYVQDNWRVLPTLTVNLGLRWDYYSPVDERDALELLPVLQNNNPITTLFSNDTLNFAGSAVGRPWYHKDLKTFAPNVGLAWDVFGTSRTVVRAGYGINYVDDDTISALNNSLTTNKGLQAVPTQSGLKASVQNLPPISVPAFQVPRTLADNYAISTTSALGLPNPDLRTPYVQQWNVGIQQRIKGGVLEARYVGNHATGQLRAIDYNQVDIQSNGFLTDFQKAQNNGLIAQKQTGRFDPTYAGPGSQPLLVFPLLTSGGMLTNSTVVGLIQTGQAGQLANLYQTSLLNGSVNFYRNPLIQGANYMTNYSNATYNALQINYTKQTLHGLSLQGNYTYSKALSDSAGDGQNRFEPFLDINNGKIEKARTINDLTHVFKGNGVYDLPMGKGHAVNWRPVNRIIGGWQIGSLFTWESGAPFSILSGRDTLNRTGRSTYNTANTSLTKSQLNSVVKFQMTGNGPVFIVPSAINPVDGRGVSPDGSAPFSGQVFSNPAAGAIGALQRRDFNGPWDFDMDLALIKQTHITERQSLELRMDATNVFNHASFLVLDQALNTSNVTNININSTTFGRVSNLAFDRRLIQLSLFYRF